MDIDRFLGNLATEKESPWLYGEVGVMTCYSLFAPRFSFSSSPTSLVCCFFPGSEPTAAAGHQLD